MSTPRPTASRRTTLGGALAVLLGAGLSPLFAGCDLDPRDGSSSATGPSDGSSTGGGTSAGPDSDPDPDVALVDEVTTALAAALAGVRTARRDQPALRATLRPLTRLHQAHLSTLDADTDADAGAAPPDAPPGSGAAGGLALVRTQEQQLATRLADAALAARSGALAAVLAQMSAAVAQHLATLPTRPGAAA